MNILDALPSFLEEADEHLDEAGQLLIEFERSGELAVLAKLKRPFHTLKGAASMMRLKGFSRVIHLLEDIVAGVLAGDIGSGESALNLLFDPVDDLKLAVSQMRETGRPVEDADFDVTLMKLELFASEEKPDAGPRPAAEALSEPAEEWDAGSEREMLPLFLTESRENLEVLSRVALEIEENSATPDRIDVIFRAIHSLKGSSGVMGLQKMQHLAHALEDHLDQVRSGKIELSANSVDCMLKAHDCLASILDVIESGAAIIQVPVHQLCESFRRFSESGQAVKPRPPIAPEDKTPDRGEEAEEPAAQKTAAASSSQSQTIRVEVAKLDRAMNLVGEIAVERIRLEQRVRDLNGLSESIRLQQRKDVTEEEGQTMRLLEELVGELKQAVDHFGFLSGELQEAIMKTRMIPVAHIFRRFPRTVRDISRTLGKNIELVLEGEETEMDKNLVEAISDPLMHLLRNSMDHGLESAEERQRTGKPPRGRLKLAARHEAGEILIEIEDDGRGIDIARVKEIAVARGVITRAEADALTDEAAVSLIFQAGFSTAEEVTELSGRGVGMDVVREAISRVKGSIAIATRPHKGTTITIRLPLTLAIIHVLVISAGGETFALPLTSVEEALTFTPEMIKPIGEGRALILRNRSFPVAALSEILGVGANGSGGDSRRQQSAVIFTAGGQSAALLVDALLGKQEVVIKSLGHWLARCPFVSGATILGNGRVISILEPADLLKALRECRQPAAGLVQHAQKGATAVPEKRGRVLLADDSATARAFLRQIYESLGFEVDETQDGREALEQARSRRFDLVSTDMMMPHMDGYQLTEALRKLPGYENVPIVMISSRGERIDKTRGFSAGVDEYFLKPVDSGLLVKSLKTLGALASDFEEVVG